MTTRGRTLRSVCTSADVFVTSCVTSMRTHSWCSPLSARARALRCAGVREQTSRGAPYPLHDTVCGYVHAHRYVRILNTLVLALSIRHTGSNAFARAPISVAWTCVVCAPPRTRRRTPHTPLLSRTAGLVAPAHRAREGACVWSLSRRHGGRIGASDASPWPARARHRSRSLAEPASRSRREASRPREVRYHSRACLRSCGACCCAPTHPARRSRSERVPR
mmetsp:Transcript_27231/g.81098  ORF Transcript_27231/g.81098 Transcript_27231/m.81098 type:complete len:221 (+) Transcript_27231:519-1181(+)